MLVHLRQYRRDDAKETVRSEGDVDPDRETEEYFDEEDVNEDDWERVTRGGETLLMRPVTRDDVTAISMPEEETDADEGLPGRTIQLRVEGGEIEYVEAAEIIEVQDANP